MEHKITNGVFWHPTGFRAEVRDNLPLRNGSDLPLTLYLNDLNPETRIVHCMTRGAALRMAAWLAYKALFPNAWSKDTPR